VWVEKYTPAEMGKILLEKHKIFTAPIDGAGVRGVRVSPNIYTSMADCDQLVKALKEMAG
jgi:selenocysteine lyase/cysteine desulfurase